MATRGRTTGQIFALVVGGVYLLVGVVGYAVTGFTNWMAAEHSQLIGFEINPLHNLVHLLLGVAWVAGAARPAAAKSMNLTLGIVLLAVAFIGLTGALGFLAIDAGLVPDFWLHLLTGLVSLYFGVMPAMATTQGRRPSGRPITH